MLDAAQTETLRQRLSADLTRLTHSAHDNLDFSMDRDRGRIGRDSMDESTEEEMYSTQLRLADRENFLLVKIQEALIRLDKGVIDDCEECGEAISFKRLMARPVTTQCFECKQAAEKAESEEVAH